VFTGTESTTVYKLMEELRVRACALPYSDAKVAHRAITGHLKGWQKRLLERWKIPHFRGVRVALGTGCHSGEGKRRASRNGRVSHLQPKNPNPVRAKQITARGG
jgi:hypothetical protein